MQSLPILTEPYDVLRQGLPSAVPALAAPSSMAAAKPQLSVREMYGLGAALKVEQDVKLAENFHRFPGIPSSFLGLQTVTGEISDIEVHDWLGEPLERKNLQCDFHVTMEKALKM
jgi:proteasome maturation protein